MAHLKSLGPVDLFSSDNSVLSVSSVELRIRAGRTAVVGLYLKYLAAGMARDMLRDTVNHAAHTNWWRIVAISWYKRQRLDPESGHAIVDNRFATRAGCIQL